MKKRLRLFLILVGLAVLAIIIRIALRPIEPKYDGKSVTYWIEHVDILTLYGADVPNSEAYEAVEALGADAVPYLRRELRGKDSKFRTQYLYVWIRAPKWLRKIMPTPMLPISYRRSSLILILERIGAPAKEAVPDLIWVMNAHPDLHTVSGAASALGAIAPGSGLEESAVAALKKAKQDHAHVRHFTLIESNVDSSLSKIEGPETSQVSPQDGIAGDSISFE